MADTPNPNPAAPLMPIGAPAPAGNGNGITDDILDPTLLAELPAELQEPAPAAPTPEQAAAAQQQTEMQQMRDRLREIEIENSVLRVAQEERRTNPPTPPGPPPAAPTPSHPDFLEGYDVQGAVARLQKGDLTALTEMVNHAAGKAFERGRSESSTQLTVQQLAQRDEQAAMAAFPELTTDPGSQQPQHPEFYTRVKQTVQAWTQAAGHYTPGSVLAAAKSVAFDMMQEGKLVRGNGNGTPEPAPQRPAPAQLPRPVNPGLGERTPPASATGRDPMDDLTPRDRAYLVQNAKKMGVDPKVAYANYLKHRKENPGYGSGR